MCAVSIDRQYLKKTEVVNEKARRQNTSYSYFSTACASSSLHFSKKIPDSGISVSLKEGRKNGKRIEYMRKVFLLSMCPQTCHKNRGVF